MLQELKETVFQAGLALPKHGLVKYTTEMFLRLTEKRGSLSLNRVEWTMTACKPATWWYAI